MARILDDDHLFGGTKGGTTRETEERKPDEQRDEGEPRGNATTSASLTPGEDLLRKIERIEETRAENAETEAENDAEAEEPDRITEDVAGNLDGDEERRGSNGGGGVDPTG